MLSERAWHGIGHIFTRAVTTNLAVSPTDRVEVERLDDQGLAALAEKNIVVLTIASYVFRLLTLFHVDSEGPAKAYFTGSGAAGELLDGFGEIGNRCCGAMNRELGKYFQHLGMSTPALLEGRCLPFLTELKPACVAHHAIRINDELLLHASLCLCAYAPIDFEVDRLAATEATGELELF